MERRELEISGINRITRLPDGTLICQSFPSMKEIQTRELLDRLEKDAGHALKEFAKSPKITNLTVSVELEFPVS